MKRLRYIWPRASVVLLASFVAGVLFAPYSATADDVVWTSAGDAWVYTSASSGDVFVTNITFVSIEDYDEFIDQCVDRATYLQGVNNALGDDISSAQSYLRNGVGFVQYAQDRIANARDENDDFYVDTELGFADRNLDNSLLMFNNASNSISSASDKQVVIRDELSSFKSFLRTDNTSHLQINLVWTNANGSCSCPDYTSILESIEGYIYDIREVVQRWDTSFYQSLTYFFEDFDNFFWDFFFESSSPYSPNGFLYDYRSFLQYMGRNLGNPSSAASAMGDAWGHISSNLLYNIRYPLDFSRDLYTAAMFSGASLYGPNLAGDYDPVVRLVWNGLMKPLADSFNPSAEPWVSDNNLFAGYFRDYYINPPTNVTAHVVSSPDNPVWVAFTNAVTLDFDLGSLSSVAVTNFRELVEMANLEVWNVNVTNVHALAEAVVDAQLQKAQESLEDEEGEEIDQDTEVLPDSSSSLGSLSRIGGKYSQIVTSYVNMFESIPDDPPDDIMIWEGGTIGGIDVPSIHWNLSEYNGSRAGGFLQAIRGLFSSLWFVIYLAVIYHALAIDLFVAGVCLYMVYGLLLGRPQAAVDGLQYMYRLLCSILGWKPPSK